MPHCGFVPCTEGSLARTEGLWLALLWGRISSAAIQACCGVLLA